jgi:hypothetical protein
MAVDNCRNCDLEALGIQTHHNALTGIETRGIRPYGLLLSKISE